MLKKQVSGYLGKGKKGGAMCHWCAGKVCDLDWGDGFTDVCISTDHTVHLKYVHFVLLPLYPNIGGNVR